MRMFCVNRESEVLLGFPLPSVDLLMLVTEGVKVLDQVEAVELGVEVFCRAVQSTRPISY